MTTTDLATQDTAAMIERVVIDGDLSQLTPEQRVHYYIEVCTSLGLNWRTKPFDYLELDDGRGNKRLTLYARRDCTDQLREKHGISITHLDRERMEDLYVVTAHARDRNGREDQAIGAVPISKETGEWKTSSNNKRYFQGTGTFVPLSGEALANAFMKCETKAKRRVTLSLCGLGMTDESEVDSIPGARTIEMEVPAALPAAAQQSVTGPQQTARAAQEHSGDTTGDSDITYAACKQLFDSTPDIGFRPPPNTEKKSTLHAWLDMFTAVKSGETKLREEVPA